VDLPVNLCFRISVSGSKVMAKKTEFG